MKTRMDLGQELPKAYDAMLGMEKFVITSSLEKSLIELVKIRASQINGCAFCIMMHTADARKHGETEKRIYALSAWRDTPYFTERESAALALTESITLIAQNHVPDSVYEEAARHFDTKQLGELIMAIITINGWNRLAISTGKMPE
ncbi:carboxymuconolactone decarboxylase family protein [Paenibacillus sp. GSMTC-2017]|uniref:carboxymuconolactone decarboxylase family protein n=1 Tax=Paenibacillus sp. GSMTC-2017 TaxID=2794350 RepID=UPI0018D6C86C|nr:carboxymuconolactone decarboxylase family protein [Paenibacillus sp. GSMTC-2017]MBH5320542.1 carboxymuconolactone decarboxylase family protein [Paenibacillus sp. GSMTC-2017]